MTAEDPPVRPEAVQAIFDALNTMDPAKALALREFDYLTEAERDQARQLFLATGLASQDHRARVAEVWSLLISRQWEQPPSWQQLFDELTPEQVARLGDLYDAMPDPARAEYDRRYGRPDLTGDDTSTSDT